VNEERGGGSRKGVVLIIRKLDWKVVLKGVEVAKVTTKKGSTKDLRGLVVDLIKRTGETTRNY